MDCITIDNAYCNKPKGIRDLKRKEGATKTEACRNRCNKGKLLENGEYQDLDYNCRGSFIYRTKEGKKRCYHCDNKGEIGFNSATSGLQLCDTAYTNYITNYSPGRQDMIKPDQCNWDMLSDDYKSQYTLKNNCTWGDLSDEKKATANQNANAGMIIQDNCNWDMLSDEKKATANQNAKRGMIMPNQCNWDNLSEDKRTAANDIAKEGMIIPNNCTWANLSEEEKNKRKNKRLEELEEDDSDDDLVECEINENEVMCGDGL